MISSTYSGPTICWLLKNLVRLVKWLIVYSPWGLTELESWLVDVTVDVI